MNDVNDVKVQLRIDKTNYQPTTTSRGTKSLNNGDEVAVALAGLPVEYVYEVVDQVIGDNDFRQRYANNNTGMQRMHLGNKLRGFLSCGGMRLSDQERENLMLERRNTFDTMVTEQRLQWEEQERQRKIELEHERAEREAAAEEKRPRARGRRKQVEAQDGSPPI